MSVNPDTGLPEYFLGDVFDTVKESVKNIFKPENIIPAVASIALPAIAGPAFGGTTLGGILGPTASQAFLSGAGTALGSLPFRSPSDALSAGIVSGGLQFGTSKLKEFLGGIGGSAFEDGASVEDQRRFMAEKARAKYLQDVDARQNFIDNLGGEDFGDSIIDTDFDAAVAQATTAAPQPIQLQNQQLQQLLTLPENQITKAELQRLGRGLQQLQTPRIEAVTGLQAMTPAETRSFIQGEIEGADQFFGPTPTQQQAMARQEAIKTNRFVTPESFDRFATAREAFRQGDPLNAAKEFASELDFGDVGRGLASVEATSLVDAVEAQRIAEEQAVQQLINQGIPSPIARRRVAARRRVGEFGGTGAGLTAAEARRRAIEGGGFEFFGPTQFVPAAQGGLINLAAGGKPDFEGIVGGDGHGMEDNQIMEIKGGGLLAVSPKEYVVPADVMAMIGNGNPDDGADEMDEFISKFRKEKYGRDMQPPEMDGGKALQSLIS